MGKKIFILCLASLTLCSIKAWCQDLEYLIDGLEIATEAQYSHSNGSTPLWLNANKYGLSSLNSENGYFRISAIRPINNDSTNNWQMGYGIDVAVTKNYASSFIVNQAFLQFNYKNASFTIGSKYRQSAFANQELSSGALAYGWNSRPIPQASLDIDKVSFPGTKGWWKWKFHLSYGMTTDGAWQKSVVPDKEHYTSNVLYHEKALYWQFGKNDYDPFPITFDLGLQFASFFGGTTYNFKGRVFTDYTDIKHPMGFKAFINSLTCTGSDENDGSSKNTAGNHVGSWIGKLTWHDHDWTASLRFERLFEDQSMMFIQYGWYDHLVGADIDLFTNPFISGVTIEHMSTRDQSGAVMHDAATNIPDKMNGMDNYYNHSIYAGYSHYGQTNGNPLITSPIYNDNGSIIFKNNRLTAWHIGITGAPCNWLHWRALATFTNNWGTYDNPLDDPVSQNYFLLETYIYPEWMKGWETNIGVALDRGKLIGNNTGIQFTIRKKFHI